MKGGEEPEKTADAFAPVAEVVEDVVVESKKEELTEEPIARMEEEEKKDPADPTRPLVGEIKKEDMLTLEETESSEDWVPLIDDSIVKPVEEETIHKDHIEKKEEEEEEPIVEKENKKEVKVEEAWPTIAEAANKENATKKKKRNNRKKKNKKWQKRNLDGRTPVLSPNKIELLKDKQAQTTA